MPGFYITNCTPVLPENMPGTDCIREQMQVDEFFVCRNTRRQFLKDKLFYQNEKYAVILEGVLLNKGELMETYAADSYEKLVEALIEKDPQGFCKEFRGMFSGAVYHKASKEWMVFSDQVGNRMVLYYVKDGKVIIGSQMNYIVDTMKANALERRGDVNGSKQFLLYGSFMDNSTWLADVKRVLPCDAVKISAEGAASYTYHVFPETYRELSDAEAVRELDETFCQAVKRALDKNKEYGYTGVIDISGGADSRMVAYTAKRLGCENVVMAHYSQSGTYEMKVALEVAADLEMECYLNPLDDAGFLTDPEKIISMNSGAADYSGITGGERVLRTLSSRNPGIELTGILGTIRDGIGVGDCEMAVQKPSLAFRKFLCTPEIKEADCQVNILDRYKTNHVFWHYTRAMLGGLSTAFTRQNYVEPYTPFGDVDFLDTFLTIHPKQLVKNQLQLRWMVEKYPKAAAIRHSVTALPLSWELKPWFPVVEELCSIYYRGMGKITGFCKIYMNPFLKWDREKPWLRQWTDSYFREGLEQVRQSGLVEEELLERADWLYHVTPQQKYAAITAVTCWKKFLI